jgi:hypothetical protein
MVNLMLDTPASEYLDVEENGTTRCNFKKSRV